VNRKALWLLIVFPFLAVVCVKAQSNQAIQTQMRPAASESDIECSGFFSPRPIRDDLQLVNGADNDFFDPLHQFVPGDDVYLWAYVGSGPAIGSEWRLVRPAGENVVQAWGRSGLGGLYGFDYTRHYSGQTANMSAMGMPYEDVGRVKVVKNALNGFVAQVISTCGAINPGDIAIPYEPRPVPTYAPAALDRFGHSSGLRGLIAAMPDNRTIMGTGGIAYINLGQQKNVKPGDHFRILRNLQIGNTSRSAPELPLETVGELVVLWTQAKSSVGVVVSTHRGVDLGDIVEGED